MDPDGILPMQVPETPVDPPRSGLRYLESSSDSLGSAPQFTRILAKMDARLAVFPPSVHAFRRLNMVKRYMSSSQLRM